MNKKREFRELGSRAAFKRRMPKPTIDIQRIAGSPNKEAMASMWGVTNVGTTLNQTNSLPEIDKKKISTPIKSPDAASNMNSGRLGRKYYQDIA